MGGGLRVVHVWFGQVLSAHHLGFLPKPFSSSPSPLKRRRMTRQRLELAQRKKAGLAPSLNPRDLNTPTKGPKVHTTSCSVQPKPCEKILFKKLFNSKISLLNLYPGMQISEKTEATSRAGPFSHTGSCEPAVAAVIYEMTTCEAIPGGSPLKVHD